MYVHMFAFRWKPGVTQEQKNRVLAGIRGLQGQKFQACWKQPLGRIFLRADRATSLGA